MLIEILPFQFTLDTTAIAGTSLWSLGLYLGGSPISAWVTEQLNRWFNFAEQSLYTSSEEFEKTRQARESQNALYASVFSIVPFLVLGALVDYGLVISLNHSWAISLGLLTCIGTGVYELGRRDGKSP